MKYIPKFMKYWGNICVGVILPQIASRLLDNDY